jgi:hypothetical protein
MAFNINGFRNHFTRYGEFAKADKFEVHITIPNSIGDNVDNIDRIKDLKIDSRELALQCEAAEFPGRNISTVDFVHYGLTERLPHFNSYGPVTLTFYCNGEFTEKKFFDYWLDSIIPNESGLARYSSLGFYSDIKIIQYSQIADAGGEFVEKQEASLDERIWETVKNAGKDIGKSAIEKIAGAPFEGIRGIFQEANGLPKYNEKTFTPRKVYECRLENAFPVAISPLNLSWSDDGIHRLQVTFVYKRWSNVGEGSVKSYGDPNIGTSNFGDVLRPLDQRIRDTIVNQGFKATKKFVLGKLNF